MPNTAIQDTVTSINATNMEVLANAPAQSTTLVYQVLANSISLSMQNAQADYAGMLKVGNAIVSVAVANIARNVDK